MVIHQNAGAATRAFLARAHGLLIDGNWVESLGGQRSIVIDPATEEVIATASAACEADVDLAVGAARRALEGAWRRIKPAQRARMLFRLAELVERHGDELAELECLNSGKPLRFCRNMDVPGVAEMLRYMGGWATKICGDAPPVSIPGEWAAYTLREPVGVVGQIVPWNFPLNMAVWKIAPALAAGCTIILKPAEQTPLSALRLAALALEAEIPPGVFNVVTGYGTTVGAALARHPGVDKIAFTGSTQTGKQIVRDALGNLKRVSLELGGKSPVIVLPDADLKLAAEAAARTVFFHAGQVCAAGSRLFAHASIFDELVDLISQHARAMKIGHGMDADTDLGPLISQRQRDSVHGYIECGRLEGAHVHTAGARMDGPGYFMAPTILTGVTPGMRVVDEEIFGPVLCAMSFGDESLDEIAERANASPYGLSASIWTRDVRAAHRLAHRLQAGSVGINVHSAADASLPYGGYKQSGWGRERGFDAIEMYTEVKTVTINLN